MKLRILEATGIGFLVGTLAAFGIGGTNAAFYMVVVGSLVCATTAGLVTMAGTYLGRVVRDLPGQLLFRAVLSGWLYGGMLGVFLLAQYVGGLGGISAAMGLSIGLFVAVDSWKR